MGREGFEPSTLGLRVRADTTRPVATCCNKLHPGLKQVATNYGTCGIVETNLYAQTYARALSIVATGRQAKPCERHAGATKSLARRLIQRSWAVWCQESRVDQRSRRWLGPCRIEAELRRHEYPR